MALINKPPDGAVDLLVINPDGKPELRSQALGWPPFFSACFTLLATMTLSGTTAKRPAIVFPGQPYFDTSLGANGKPIWANKGSTGWVDATGAAV